MQTDGQTDPPKQTQHLHFRSQKYRDGEKLTRLKLMKKGSEEGIFNEAERDAVGNHKVDDCVGDAGDPSKFQGL